MKRILVFIALLVLVVPVFGCSDAPEEPESAQLPLISITTEDQSKDALDFVTEPVAGHVSEQIATWTPNYKMPPEPYYEPCSVTVTDGEGTVAVEAAKADVKVRGNWTTTYPKKPLRIRFEEAQTMLGLNEGAELKNWVLLAEYKDGSMLRNKAALAIAEGILAPDDLYCADSTLVELEINGEYMGVYLLTEQQQVNSDRVDITDPEKNYKGTDIGYFLEFDGYAYSEDELNQFYVSYVNNAPLVPYDGSGGGGRKMAGTNTGFTIKSDIYSAEQRDFIAGYVDNVYRIMYMAAVKGEAYVFSDDYSRVIRTTDISPREAVERVVNVESLADMYIVSEVTCDADIYLTSFFMSADFGPEGDPRLIFEAPWDFDSAMGNKDRCADGKGFYAANILWDVNHEFETINPWLAVLMYEDWFREIITEKWTAAYNSGVFSRALDIISHDAALYSAAFERNYKKWDNLVNNQEFASELSAGAAKCRTHGQAAQYLYEWLESRVAFLNEHWHA